MDNIDKFLANNYLSATITINKKNGKLVHDLFLTSTKPKNEKYIQVYSVNLEELKSDEMKLIIYMLKNFLENNIILGINYNDRDSNKIEIIAEHRKICIKSDSINIKYLFADILRETEFLKCESILKKVSSLEKTEKDRHFLLSLDKERTGYTRFFHQFFEYKILYSGSWQTSIMEPREINFVKILIKELINNHCDMEISKLEQMKNYINNIKFDNSKKRMHVSLKFNNLVFDLCDNEANLQILLKFFEIVLDELILENSYETSKQLVMTMQ